MTDDIFEIKPGALGPRLNVRALLRHLAKKAELDALQAQVDALTRLQAETAAELDALLPSILAKAFKGEL